MNISLYFSLAAAVILMLCLAWMLFLYEKMRSGKQERSSPEEQKSWGYTHNKRSLFLQYGAYWRYFSPDRQWLWGLYKKQPRTERFHVHTSFRPYQYQGIRDESSGKNRNSSRKSSAFLKARYQIP